MWVPGSASIVMPYEAIDCFSWYNFIDQGPKPPTRAAVATFTRAATIWLVISCCVPVSCSCGYVVGVVFRIVVLGALVIAGAIVIGGVVVVGSSVVAGAGVVDSIVAGVVAVVVVELAEVVVFAHETRIISIVRAVNASLVRIADIWGFPF